MKTRKLPFLSQVTVQLNEDEEKLLFSSSDFEMHKKIRKRGQGIVQSGLDIEHYVKEIISKILFSSNKDKEFLTGVFLDTSDCTFSSKKRILESTLSYLDIFKPKKIAKLQRCLSKVMKYRNAFAHGSISPIEPFTITYFEGSQQVKELDEEYWEELFSHFKNAFNLLEELNTILNSTEN